MIGLIGKKIGMTQVFGNDSSLVGVTAIQAGPCPVLAVKEKNIQLGFESVAEKKLNKAQAAFFKKINISPRKVMKEFSKEASKEYKIGDELKVDIFAEGDFVDVSGVSIGKGFQGGMKRWNWAGGPATHGSTSHRRIGSIGSTTTPGRVWKGHHLPGHMGAVKVTIQNLKVVRVDADNNVILVEGAVPGHKNGYLMVTKAKKKFLKKAAANK
ncbi:MAG: 50S ribosomal protein L3 [Candidatus Omnitrophica bacterium]|nr:50S ribosomal protein L3 [Candidatus Omnitrophota bacterium]